MKKRIIRLTEAEFNKLVRESVKKEKKRIQEQNYLNPDAMETGEAIVTMVVTIMTLLGVSGYDYIKDMINSLMEQGEEEKALEVESVFGELRR